MGGPEGDPDPNNLTLIDLAAMPLAKAEKALSNMSAEEVLQKWKGTPPEMREKWSKKLQDLINQYLVTVDE